VPERGAPRIKMTRSAEISDGLIEGAIQILRWGRRAAYCLRRGR
jgi:hypothetical protein